MNDITLYCTLPTSQIVHVSPLKTIPIYICTCRVCTQLNVVTSPVENRIEDYSTLNDLIVSLITCIC